MFDDQGPMAYHTAVHDAFGYLKVFHDTGPGYDYMESSPLDDDYFMAGHVGGIAFWNETVTNMECANGRFITL